MKYIRIYLKDYKYEKETTEKLEIGNYNTLILTQ